MLTEGWDAKCTHILGYRAFSTQLLCEQVVGRALRRSSYDVGRGRAATARVRRGPGRAVRLPPARIEAHRAATGTAADLRGQDASRQADPPYRLPAHCLLPICTGIGEPAPRPRTGGAVHTRGRSNDGCDGGRGGHRGDRGQRAGRYPPAASGGGNRVCACDRLGARADGRRRERPARVPLPERRRGCAPLVGDASSARRRRWRRRLAATGYQRGSAPGSRRYPRRLRASRGDGPRE